MNKIDELEKFFTEKDNSLYFLGFENTYPDFQEFFKNINRLSQIFNTYSSTSESMTCATGVDRSLQDSFLLCRHYFGTSLTEFLKHLKKLYSEGYLVGHFCRDIERNIVGHMSTSAGWNLFNTQFTSESLLSESLDSLLNLV